MTDLPVAQPFGPIAPRRSSLLDPQVNGYAGVDFQNDDLGVPGLESAVAAWRRDGGDRFLLTLVTDDWTRLLARLRRLVRDVRKHATLREVIAGWHVEGPFLSPLPGFHGAHDPAAMLDPLPEHLRALRDAAADETLLVTLAPERVGALAAIELARRLGMRVSLGHTDASAACLRSAVDAGAEAFTHLGNGCPQQLDRHDNILWRVADTKGLLVGLIADAIHVAPSLFRLLHRVLPPEAIYYTTDAMSAAGAPPGEYGLGRLRLTVGEDGVVRQPGRQNFAGSSLTPQELERRVVSMLGGVEEGGGRLLASRRNVGRFFGL